MCSYGDSIQSSPRRKVSHPQTFTGAATLEGSLQFRPGACLSLVDLDRLYVSILSVFTEMMIPRVSLVAQWSRIPLLMKEMWVPSMSPEVPLEKEMVTHSGILAWEIP